MMINKVDSEMGIRNSSYIVLESYGVFDDKVVIFNAENRRKNKSSYSLGMRLLTPNKIIK